MWEGITFLKLMQIFDELFTVKYNYFKIKKMRKKIEKTKKSIQYLLVLEPWTDYEDT